MVIANCNVSVRQIIALSPRGNLLTETLVYLNEDVGDDVRVGDVISDSSYNEQQVFSIASKNSQQDYILVLEDIRQTKKAPSEGRGIIFTPTPKWRLARVGASTIPDQFRAVYDESNREIIDENLGGVRDSVLPHTITADDVSQGFIDISSISPIPLESNTFRLTVIDGIEQLNADNMLNIWGRYPDYQVQLGSVVKRIVFKNHGQPTVPLTGHLGEGDVLQIVYKYKA
jgi:hypothetical protein